MKTRIGCSGWQYSEWKDKFYGPGLAKSGWFDFYAKHYNTVEINYSYYQFPSEKTILAWREQAPHNFTYSLKVNKSIIYKRFINTKSMLNDFYGLAKLLGSTLDCLLIQWPASVKYDLGLLHRMLEQLDPSMANVIEFRDPSWWRDDVIKALNEHDHLFCSVSAPGLPETLINCKERAYLRFHGRHRWFYGSYAKSELQRWANELKKSGIKKVWAYFNNTADANAPKNALLLEQLLRQ